MSGPLPLEVRTGVMHMPGLVQAANTVACANVEAWWLETIQPGHYISLSAYSSSEPVDLIYPSLGHS